MPVPGCCCYGGNTPTLEHYCACQGIGDRRDYDARTQAGAFLLTVANFEYYEGDEMLAYHFADLADEAARNVKRETIR
jgi:hypothetical protein